MLSGILRKITKVLFLGKTIFFNRQNNNLLLTAKLYRTLNLNFPAQKKCVPYKKETIEINNTLLSRRFCYF